MSAVMPCSAQKSSIAVVAGLPPLPAELSFLRPHEEVDGLHGDGSEVPEVAERPVHGDHAQVGAEVVRGDGVDDDVEPVTGVGHLFLIRRDDESVGAETTSVVGLVG